MHIILGIFAFIFGTIIGSFLNVVALRYNTGRSIVGISSKDTPRKSSEGSLCFSCQKKLSWYELIPVFSFIFSGGRCRSCGSKISFQYPFVEFLTGVLLLGVFLKFSYILESSLSNFLFSIFYFFTTISLLVIILVYDLRHKIIPNLFVYLFVLLALGNFFIEHGLVFTYIELFSGPLIALPFFLLWLVSRGTWMGLGDAKLALGIGWFLGVGGGFSALLVSFWSGAIISIILVFLPYIQKIYVRVMTNNTLYLANKHFTMKSEIPFAPFLIFGFLLIFFFDISVLEFFVW